MSVFGLLRNAVINTSFFNSPTSAQPLVSKLEKHIQYILKKKKNPKF